LQVILTLSPTLYFGCRFLALPLTDAPQTAFLMLGAVLHVYICSGFLC
jgi:hypothetical protein